MLMVKKLNILLNFFPTYLYPPYITQALLHCFTYIIVAGCTALCSRVVGCYIPCTIGIGHNGEVEFEDGVVIHTENA